MSHLPIGHFGIQAIEIYKSVICDSEILNLLEEILTATYEKYFGDEGVDFVRTYFQELRGLPQDSSFDLIKKLILKLRDIFRKSTLCSRYHDSFRRLNLATSLRVVGFELFSGTVVDIGADDNMLGYMLLELCPTVSHVIGVDVETRDPIIVDGKLEFRCQNSLLRLPVVESEADTVVVRYSFHHMSLQEQVSIRDEIARVLKPKGNLIVYENTFSFTIHPLVDNYGFHSKMLNLHDPVRIHLLLSALDVFSNGIKRKEIPFPYTYKMVEDWNGFFEAGGFDSVETRYFGFPLYDLHQAPMGVFILENRETI